MEKCFCWMKYNINIAFLYPMESIVLKDIGAGGATYIGFSMIKSKASL